MAAQEDRPVPGIDHLTVVPMNLVAEDEPRGNESDEE